MRAWRGAAGLREQALGPVVAVHDRHQRLPDRAGAPQARCCRTTSARPPRPHTPPGEPVVESMWIEPYPDEAIGLPAGGRRAGGQLRAARGGGAGVRRRAAAPGGQPARGADAARGARLQRRGDGDDARHDGRRRSTARCSGRAPRSRSGCPSAPSRRRCARSATTALRELVDRYVDAWERCDVGAFAGDARRGRDVRDAAAGDLVHAARHDRHVGRHVADVRRVAVAGRPHPAPTRSRRSPSTPGTTRGRATCRSRSTCSACAMAAGQRRDRVHRALDRCPGARGLRELPRPSRWTSASSP